MRDRAANFPQRGTVRLTYTPNDARDAAHGSITD